jgi:hypothetical protein
MPTLARYAPVRDVRRPICECFVGFGMETCTARAAWLVGVGKRKVDAQYSCGRHLHQTCHLLRKAEGRDVVLTVVLVQ